MWMSGGSLMSEGGEARNHEAEVDAVAFELEGGLGGKRDWKIKGNSHAAARAAIAALDALRRSPQKRKGHDPGCDLPSAHRGPCRRSPQDEDHVERMRELADSVAERTERIHAPQGEDHEHRCQYEPDAEGDLACPVCGRYADDGDEAADAQDEDHEAGIEAAAKFVGFTESPTDAHRMVARRAIAAYLSRCPSPEREA